MSEQENSCEIQANEPERIEIVVKTQEKTRPSICRTFDKCRHLKSPEWIENFKRLHPECFQETPEI